MQNAEYNPKTLSDAIESVEIEALMGFPSSVEQVNRIHDAMDPKYRFQNPSSARTWAIQLAIEARR